jgi:anion-transporting  ArsA/GET3 family ATPase
MNVPSRKPYAWAGIAIAAVAVVVAGHYLFGFPPGVDNLTGTITPAERYRAPQQISAADVKLGDQSVAQLLQNDAVVKLINDPEFQALAANRKALEALSALAAAPKALEALSAHPSAFHAIAMDAMSYKKFAGKPEALAASAEAFKKMNLKALEALAARPEALEAMAAHAEAFKAIAARPKALDALAAHSSALAALSARPNALDAAARASMDAKKK